MEFPILGIVDNDNMLYVFLNDKPFKKTSRELYNRGILQNERYIDSNGDIYKVKNITDLGFSGFWGFSLLLKGRQIKINTEFYPVTEKIDIEDLKSIVLERVGKKKLFWESAWNIDELTEKIKNEKSIKEIIMCFY